MAQATTVTDARFYPNRSGQWLQVSDTAENDPDKTITVPAGVVWQVLHVFMAYTSDATVGNRQVQISVTDGTNTIGYSDAAAVQTASTTEYYQSIPGATVPVETIPTQHFLPFPGPVLLPAGYAIVFDDTADIAAGDDTVVRIEVLEYGA